MHLVILEEFLILVKILFDFYFILFYFILFYFFQFNLNDKSIQIVLVNYIFENMDVSFLSPEEIIFKFFETFANWNWEQDPIDLRASKTKIESHNSPCAIVTPTFPFRNTCRNVTTSTLKCLQSEFHRAFKILQQSQLDQSLPWDQLFLKPTSTFSSYLVLELTSDSQANLESIKGYIEGKVIGLLISIEKKGLLIRPFPAPLENLESETFSSRYFIGLNREKEEEKLKISFSKEVDEFLTKFYTWEEKPANSDLRITQSKSIQ